MRTQTPVDNTLHDVQYKIKFENCVKDKNNFFAKGGLSDDLIIFKFFRVYFSLKKKTLQFPLSFNLYFQKKKEPHSCHFATYRRNALF